MLRAEIGLLMDITDWQRKMSPSLADRLGFGRSKSRAWPLAPSQFSGTRVHFPWGLRGLATGGRISLVLSASS